MKHVVFMGSKQVGLACLEILHKRSINLNYSIVGVLTNKNGHKVKDFALRNDLKLLNSLDDDYMALKNVDIVLIVQFDKILKAHHIQKANNIIVNLHRSPLPDYRGYNQFSFAIIDEAKEFGTTLHAVDEKVDSGDILFEDRFPVPERCWVYELYELTCQKSIDLFRTSLEKIIRGEFHPRPQSFYKKTRPSKFYRKSDIERIKHIDLNWSKEKIEKYIRALSMPGFAPPFITVQGKRVSTQLQDHFLD